MSSKRHAPPAPISKNQERRSQPQHGRRNHLPPAAIYLPQETSHYSQAQVYDNYQPVEDYHESYQNHRQDGYAVRQPSARISEVGSQDDTLLPSQFPEEVEEGEECAGNEGETVKHNRRSDSRQSDRSTASRGMNQGQEYEEIPFVPNSKHPSAHRLRQATSMNEGNPVSYREPVGKTIAPKPFKPVRGVVSGPNVKAQDQYEDHRYEAQDPSLVFYDPHSSSMQRGNNAVKSAYVHVPSKLKQSTKFDTPSEKGSRGNAPSTIASNQSRSSVSGISNHGRRRVGLEFDGPYDTPSITKVGRSRAIISSNKNVVTDIDLEIDPDFQEETSNDFLDSSPPKPSLLTPPSDRTLALGKNKGSIAKKTHTKQAKPKAKVISSSDGNDAFATEDLEGFLAELVDESDEVTGPKRHLALKMPKTVNQVVAHISNMLAKKVAKDQGEIAIKSSETWDWSRLPVLVSEMRGGIEDMEKLIHAAGRDRQGAIEETKRKRVELEAGNTDQYEEFRRDFREACEKMQQPAMGKRFKFGSF